MEQSNVLIIILNATAWKMQPPAMYGAFHIFAVIVMSAIASFGAWHVRKRANRGISSTKAHSASSDEARTAYVIRVLAVTGWVLVLLEIYKQLFLYYVVNGGAYDYWFFPFQLCSVPMYLCILLPAIGRSSPYTGAQGTLRTAVLTFLASYTFVSAVATFVYPEDLLRSYAALTVHGFLWHGLLLFISLTVVLTAAPPRGIDLPPRSANAAADLTARGFARATLLYLALCCVAVALNIALEPLTAARTSGALTHSYPNMFYLSPYHFSGQPLIGTVQRSAGIPAGLVLYVAATVALSACVTAAFARYFRASRHGAK